MKVYAQDLILDNHTYKMELHFPGLSWVSGQAVKLKILTLLDGYDIGADWTCPLGGDTWFLTYHVKATGRQITHGEMFDWCIYPTADSVLWVDCIDLGIVEPLFEPDIPLPEWLKDLGLNWKMIVIAVISILVALVALKALPYGRRRKAK